MLISHGHDVGENKQLTISLTNGESSTVGVLGDGGGGAGEDGGDGGRGGGVETA